MNRAVVGSLALQQQGHGLWSAAKALLWRVVRLRPRRSVLLIVLGVFQSFLEGVSTS